MNARDLLAIPGVATLPIVVVSILCALLMLYGAFKKFSRISWSGYQLVIVFAATLLLPFIPETADKFVGLAIVLGGYLLVTTAVLAVGGIVRHAIRSRRKRANVFWRIIDRLLGAVTAVFNLAMIVFVLGAFSLAVLYGMQGETDGALSVVYGLPLWQRFWNYATDLMLVAFLFFAVKWGYRLGLIRAIWVILGLALTTAAVFGSIVLTIEVGFLRDFAHKVAGVMGSNPLFARIFGHLTVSTLVFLVLFAVIVLLMIVINLLVKLMSRSRTLRIIDGAILAVVFYAVAAGFVLAFHYGIDALSALAEGSDMMAAEGGEGGIADMIAPIAQALARFGEVLRGAPLGRAFWAYNPLIA